jgi:two-component system, NtrC family, nitrogen regulation sensor histidine kinase NtrY
MAFSSPSSGKPTTRKGPRKRVRLLYEHRISLYALFVALPGILVSGILIWREPWTTESKTALSVAVLIAWWILAMALHEQTVRPLQTLANVVASLREEDYSFRARGATTEDALGELSLEVNALADLLADQRIGAIEATALLRRVVEEIDAPLFAFDPDRVLRLVNPAGERLVQQAAIRILGRTADEIGLADCLNVTDEALVTLPASSSSGRWLVRQSKFREKGVPHTLVVLLDVSRALREEERSAWKKLIRVLGHELNNSLTPIKSIAGSLSARLREAGMNADQRLDFERGLEIIEARSASLNRFLQAYRALAQMPPPAIRRVALSPIVERVVFLETRLPITMLRGPDVTLMVDPDQIEQMLINLVRNAVEATLETGRARDSANASANVGVSANAAANHGANTHPDNSTFSMDASQPQVMLSWKLEEPNVVLNIDDNGPGLLNPSNAFVPFYTTKPAGSGIGLALSRQIVEAHGGSIELANRNGSGGCRVRVLLPHSSR